MEGRRWGVRQLDAAGAALKERSALRHSAEQTFVAVKDILWMAVRLGPAAAK
jgi:hypothetical protein